MASWSSSSSSSCVAVSADESNLDDLLCFGVVSAEERDADHRMKRKREEDAWLKPIMESSFWQTTLGEIVAPDERTRNLQSDDTDSLVPVAIHRSDGTLRYGLLVELSHNKATVIVDKTLARKTVWSSRRVFDTVRVCCDTTLD